MISYPLFARRHVFDKLGSAAGEQRLRNSAIDEQRLEFLLSPFAFHRAGDREKMADAREVGTVFRWEIRGPRMWSSEVRAIFTYSSSIIWPPVWGETNKEVSDNEGPLYNLHN
jgi:hypothetical protein